MLQIELKYMLSYSKCFEIVENRLSLFSFERNPVELYQPVKYILSIGGKRIRPCLTLMSHSLFSDSVESIIDPALGFEVFHNFTLLHDDIMDKATVRRNSPTVHIKWDENAAILSGDAMLILAYQLISRTQPEVLQQVFRLFNKTALEVCEGQQLDMNFENKSNVSVEDYMEMIRLKTAVLIAASIAMGGITANAHSSDIDNLYQFGLNIGMAFQLQDDYLDVFASNRRFGKAIGGDIISNKKTFLMISALHSPDTKLVAELRSWINRLKADQDEKIKAVKKIYETLQIPTKTNALVKKYFSSGLRYLNEVSADKKRKTPLIEFVTQIMERDH